MKSPTRRSSPRNNNQLEMPFGSSQITITLPPGGRINLQASTDMPSTPAASNLPPTPEPWPAQLSRLLAQAARELKSSDIKAIIHAAAPTTGQLQKLCMALHGELYHQLHRRNRPMTITPNFPTQGPVSNNGNGKHSGVTPQPELSKPSRRAKTRSQSGQQTGPVPSR